MNLKKSQEKKIMICHLRKIFSLHIISLVFCYGKLNCPKMIFLSQQINEEGNNCFIYWLADDFAFFFLSFQKTCIPFSVEVQCDYASQLADNIIGIQL